MSLRNGLLATSAYQKRTSDPESCDKNASVACVSRFGFSLSSWSSCSLPATICLAKGREGASKFFGFYMPPRTVDILSALHQRRSGLLPSPHMSSVQVRHHAYAGYEIRKHKRSTPLYARQVIFVSWIMLLSLTSPVSCLPAFDLVVQGRNTFSFSKPRLRALQPFY